jgi:deoxyribose-phosphate aldolase
MQFSAYKTGDSEIANRIQTISNQSLTSQELAKAWQTIFSCIDLTTLEATDHAERIEQFCEMALRYPQQKQDVSVAAVCIYSPFVAQAKKQLANSAIRVATVACGFPSGQMPFELKLAEVRYAAEQGADEIDMVISRGTFLSGAYSQVQAEVKAVKEACGDAHLKVILETGELKTIANIRKASELAILGGADFIKTSTGKISPAATAEAALVMIDTIKEYFDATGIKIGLKPAGGISEPETALLYYKLVKEVLGEGWLNNQYFRIGASRLADKVFGML